jgi:hypothetical protein
VWFGEELCELQILQSLSNWHWQNREITETDTGTTAIPSIEKKVRLGFTKSGWTRLIF